MDGGDCALFKKFLLQLNTTRFIQAHVNSITAKGQPEDTWVGVRSGAQSGEGLNGPAEFKWEMWRDIDETPVR